MLAQFISKVGSLASLFVSWKDFCSFTSLVHGKLHSPSLPFKVEETPTPGPGQGFCCPCAPSLEGVPARVRREREGSGRLRGTRSKWHGSDIGFQKSYEGCSWGYHLSFGDLVIQCKGKTFG